MTGYVGFSDDVSEQSGNYIALHCASDDPDAVLTVEFTDGSFGPATLTDDGLVVLRFPSQIPALRLTNVTTGDSRDFDLTHVVREEAGDASSDVVGVGQADFMTINS